MKTKSDSRCAFFNPRVVIGFAFYAAGVVFAFACVSSAAAEDNTAAKLSPSVPAQLPGKWNATGSLNTARSFHTATLLPSGMVLVAGGQDDSFPPTSSAELYDPAIRVWTATGSMANARWLFAGTLLPNGQVLMVGGVGTDRYLASAELYDPATGLWTATRSMAIARQQHTATLLANGQVLVAGGIDNDGGVLASVELYDPITGRWRATGSMVTARWSHTATLLPNGLLLVAGGYGFCGYLASAELYDPATGLWTATGNMATSRQRHTATLLANGQVLVAGGYLTSPRIRHIPMAELYDPANGAWTAAGKLFPARSDQTATLLLNGIVLVAGGDEDNGTFNGSTRANLYKSAPEVLEIQ